MYTYSKRDKVYVEATENGEQFEKGVLCELNKRDQLPDYQRLGGTPYSQLEATSKNIVEGSEESDAQEQQPVDSIARFIV